MGVCTFASAWQKGYRRKGANKAPLKDADLVGVVVSQQGGCLVIGVWSQEGKGAEAGWYSWR